jgi:hypothetical protein
MGQPAQGDDEEPSEEAEPAQPSPEAEPEQPETPSRPVFPLRLLVLVAVVNVLLAAGLLTLRPPWRIERSAAVPPLPAQVAELQARVQSGEHQTPYALTLTDDELTATARHFLAQSDDVPFAQVRVAVVGSHLEVSGVTTGLAVAVPVKVVANAVSRDGAPVVSVAAVDIGGLALPPFVREQVLREANQAVDLSRYDLAVTVDAVTLRPGVLEARGMVR